MKCKIDLNQVIAVIAGLIAWFKSKKYLWDYLVKVITPLVEKAEEMALDGIIDKSERKQLVMQAIKQLEQDGKIKLNFITRMLVSKVVDKIADKLPDFKVKLEAKNLKK